MNQQLPGSWKTSTLEPIIPIVLTAGVPNVGAAAPKVGVLPEGNAGAHAKKFDEVLVFRILYEVGAGALAEDLT